MKKIILLCSFFLSLQNLLAQNWLPMAAGALPIGHIVYGLSAVGDDVVWVVAAGDYYEPPIPASARVWVLRTSDGGKNWVKHSVEEAPGAVAFTIVAEDSLRAWLVTQDYAGPLRAIFLTTDGGETWAKQAVPSGAGVSLHRFSDGKHWLAHNRQTTGRSDDGGKTWKSGSVSGYLSNESQLLTSGTNMACNVGDTAWNGTSAGRVVRFTQFGAASKIINTGLGSGSIIFSVAFTDARNGLCTFETSIGQGGLARTSDGGDTWGQVIVGLPKSFSTSVWNIASIPGSPGGYVLVTADYFPNGRVSVTRDGGQTWIDETLGKSLNSVVFTSPTTGWIGGGKIAGATSPAIYKYNGSPLVGAADVAAPEEFSVSPNPTSDWLRLDLPDDFFNFSNFENLPIGVFDAAGRVVFSKEISNNSLNVSDLPSGFYFLKIETLGKFMVSRFVKN